MSHPKTKPQHWRAGASISANADSELQKHLSVLHGLYGNHAAVDFSEACRRAGLVVNGSAIADGTLHRVPVEGDKSGTRNGWYCLHLDGVPAGAFGSWKGDWRETWRGGGTELITAAERQRLDKMVTAAKHQRDAETLQRWSAARESAAQEWARAVKADAAHPYLVRKNVKTHGIRQRDDVLLIPMRDGDGVLWNIQSIANNGTKRFRYGGRKTGTYHAIGGPIKEALCIVEGYATGASVHESTGLPVAVAFDCGNLAPIARVLRAKYPTARITLCADNDIHTEGNPGLTKATRAAAEIKAWVAIPPAGFNDFNDAACGVMI